MLDKDPMTSLTKEEVARSSANISSSMGGMTKGSNSTLRLDSSSLYSWRESSQLVLLTDYRSETTVEDVCRRLKDQSLSCH